MLKLFETLVNPSWAASSLRGAALLAAAPNLLASPLTNSQRTLLRSPVLTRSASKLDSWQCLVGVTARLDPKPHLKDSFGPGLRRHF